MEQKSIKTSVFNQELIFKETAEQPIDIDFTLPDYYCDISKILKCRAVSRISSKGVNGNAVFVEGCVTVTVIYCGSDNCISSYEYQYPFSKNFDTGVSTDGTNLTVKTKCEYINCRAVTSRKIDIHGAVSICVKLNQSRLTDIISDIDDCNVELLRGSVPATVPMGMADKYLTVEEEIELGNGQGDVRCLIRYDAEAVINDTKILAGKSVVSGEMMVKLLYLPENTSAMQTVRCSIPFSQLIEIEGLGEGCDCESKVYIAQLEIKPRMSASGQCRQFSLCAKLLITSECCCNNDVAVIRDAYSRKYEADINKNELCFNKICENINAAFNCKKSFEFTNDVITQISDMWCETRTDSVKFESNNMIIKGVVTAFIIAQDADSIPTFYEKTLDFEYTYPIDLSVGEYKCAPEISVAGANYTLLDDCNIEIRVDLKICAAVYNCNKVPLITNINVNPQKPIEKTQRGAMTVYFAQCGENIWDIAKKYFANVDEIKQINDISDNILINDKMILIPTE
ncbi:MAG: DUF3794 domain-containing protein [Clostridia bacterium]|nr:DUF3794 domain-containing protein [Clostridia bacterium]